MADMSPTTPGVQTTTADHARRVFLSHSHQDNAFSQRLVAALTAAGLDVWYDELNLGAGHLAPIIERELTNRDTFIVILSPAALASQWVQSEWYAAWELLGQGKIARFIPIIAQRCDIPLLLRGMRWVDFTTQSSEKGLATLFLTLGLQPPAATSPSYPAQWGFTSAIRAHPVRGCFCIDWSRDGNLIATGSYDKTARIWDAKTHAALETLTGHTNGLDAVAWSPDSATLATASLGQRIRVWDVRTRQQRELLEGHEGGVTGVAWSPDGRYLASSSDDRTARIWDLASGACRLTLRGHAAALTSVAWSPDAEWLVTTARDATIRIWSIRSGAQAQVLSGHNQTVYCARWSPDGKRLASSGNTTVRIWDVQRGETLAVGSGHTGNVLAVAWRPDGALLASASADTTVGLWDAQNGRSVAMLGGHTDWALGVAWSPDGAILASCGGAQDGTVRFWAPR